MQEKKQIISPIKQRILQFADTLGISKRDFYAKTSISRGTLESQTGITEDTATKVFATFPELSPTWVFTGNGDMLIYSNASTKNAHLNAHPNAHLSPKSEDNPPFPTMAAKPNMPYGNAPNPLYNGGEIEEKQPCRDESSDGLIKHLVEQLNEKSEEIGALKQEVNFLKDRLAQCAENVAGAKSARA